MRLKQIRQAKGVSQRQAAHDLGLSQVVYGRYENGSRQPPYAVLLAIADYFGVTTDDILGRSPDVTINNPRWVHIPVLGRVPAGIPFEAIEDVLDWEEIPAEQAKRGEYFALKVKGDSMEPRIYDGDVLIVRKQSTAESGNVVIALVNGDDATVKRFKRLEHGIMLLPNNPAYEPMVFTDEDVLKLPVEIIGVVVECRQKYNV